MDSTSERGSGSEGEGAAADRVTGLAAIAAGGAWFAWAIATTVTHGALESEGGRYPCAVLAGRLLGAAWNFLLIPAAVREQWHLRGRRIDGLAIATACGIVGLALWGVGALTVITPAMEMAYLELSAIWLFVLAHAWRPARPKLARFTLVVAAFTALDAIFCLFEPMPPALYAIAWPKLPLAAIWSVTFGIMLVRRSGRR